MKVFVSWNGELSRSFARLLQKNIPLILRGTEAILSKAGEGSEPIQDFYADLDTCQCSIICLEPESIKNPWLLFESGAIAKSGNYGCFLFSGLLAENLDGPLAQLNHLTFNKKNYKEVLKGFNREMENSKPESIFEANFQQWWSGLREGYNELMESYVNSKNRLQTMLMTKPVPALEDPPSSIMLNMNDIVKDGLEKEQKEIMQEGLDIPNQLAPKQLGLSEKEFKVLSAMVHSKFAFRALGGIASEVDLQQSEATDILSKLMTKGLIAEEKREHGTKWTATPSGNLQVINNT